MIMQKIISGFIRIFPVKQLICALLWLFIIPAFAQVPGELKKENLMEQKIEAIAENAEESEIDYTLIFDELLYFIENPINLDRTNKEQLEQLHILNEFQINNLLQHIEKNGKLLNIYELQTIEGFDQETISQILPYIKVSSDPEQLNISFKEMMKNGQHQFIVRHQQVLEDQKGYLPIEDSLIAANPNSRYLGSKDKVYTRYRFNYGSKVSYGFTAEKDAGEEFFKGSQPNGFDFYTAHLFLQGFGKLKALALGDYQAQFGQGLTFSSGLSLGKSAYIFDIKRNARGLRPSTSAEENLFLRGGGTTIGVKNFELTTFISHKNIDANIQNTKDSLAENDEVIITSFQVSGFNRTPNELLKRKLISETFYGGHFAYKKRNFKIGLTAVRSEYGALLQRDISFYNRFEFNSSQNLNLGIDYNYIYRNFNFFGEISRSENGGIAYVNGVLISLDPRVALIVMHRNYKRDYQSIHSGAVSESSKNINEQGIYTGVVLNPVSKITVSAYYDKFIFPWMKYQVSAPSYGSDYLAQVSYTPSKKADMYARIRQRNKFKNTSEDVDDIDFIVATQQTNYRYHVSYSISSSVKLINRVDIASYNIGENNPEKGYLIYQDIIYKALSSPLSFSFRYALFDTDTYNSRIYAYEKDALYSFSIPAFYYRGSRTYFTLRYTIKRNIDIWVRYAQTFYNNRNVIGSGLDEIQGNTRSEVKAQIRFKF